MLPLSRLRRQLPSPEGSQDLEATKNREPGESCVFAPGVAGDDGGAAFGHIVYAHGPCAVLGGQGGQGCGHVIALGHGRAISTGSTRPGKHRRNEALAGLANQHRISSGAEGLEPGQQRQVVLDARLGEAHGRR